MRFIEIFSRKVWDSDSGPERAKELSNLINTWIRKHPQYQVEKFERDVVATHGQNSICFLITVFVHYTEVNPDSNPTN